MATDLSEFILFEQKSNCAMDTNGLCMYCDFGMSQIKCIPSYFDNRYNPNICEKSIAEISSELPKVAIK